MIKVSLFVRCMCVLGLTSSPEISFAEDFLVRQGGSNITQEVHNTDPGSLDARWWESKLYSNRGLEWGALTSKTYQGLMGQIQLGQKIDHLWASAIGQDVESFDNHMHPGPAIAVLKQTNKPKNELVVTVELLWKIEDLSKRYKDSINAWNALTENWDKVKVKAGNIGNLGIVFKGYVSNFKDVFEKQRKLRAFLTRSDDTSGLSQSLTNFETSLSGLEIERRTLSDSLQNVDTSYTPNGN
jgi:hypothetical protein